MMHLEPLAVAQAVMWVATVVNVAAAVHNVRVRRQMQAVIARSRTLQLQMEAIIEDSKR